MRNLLIIIFSVLFLVACGQNGSKNEAVPVVQKEYKDTNKVLNAFINVNNSLEKTNRNFTSKDSALLIQITDLYKKDDKRFRPYYDKALAASMVAKNLNDYIELLKYDLIQLVDQADTTSSPIDLDAKNNYDIPTAYLIGDDPKHPKGKAVELKAKIKNCRELLLVLVDKEERSKLKLGLTTQDVYSYAEEKMVLWEENAFYHNPIAAVITILSKLQNDVLNAESDVLNSILRSMKK